MKKTNTQIRHWQKGSRRVGHCGATDGSIRDVSAKAFHDSRKAPFCSDCAKAARLALAAESAPKPDAVVWPKPRPISEAPTDEAFLGFVAADKLQTVHPGWYRMTAASDVVTVAVTGWVILGALPSRDQHFTITRLTVTHFLPLPPEVV